MTRRAGMLASGAVLSGCVASWALLGDMTHRIPAHVFLYGLAFVAYVAALPASRGLSRNGLRLALGTAVLWRLALVATPPLLSDDVYRYVWEGRIQLHDGNPYAWADRPEAEKWTALRDNVWRGVNHKGYSAIYPPLFVLFCALVVAIHDSVLAMKAALVACELLTAVALARLLSRRGLPPERLLILAWSPLALVEIAGSGHNDPLGMLLLTLALLALEAGRPLASAVAAALAFQAKLVPGFLAATWARRYRSWHLLAAAGVALALVFPYASAGSGLWRTIVAASPWAFNETLYAPLAAAAGCLAPALAAAAMLAVALALAWRRADPAASALAMTAAWLLLSSRVLPWYALWLLPMLVLRSEPALLLFTGTVGLAHFVYPGWLAGGQWQVGWGIRALEYGPCLVLAAVSRWWRR